MGRLGSAFSEYGDGVPEQVVSSRRHFRQLGRITPLPERWSARNGESLSPHIINLLGDLLVE